MKDYNNLTQGELNYKFIIACIDGNLDIVKYLLTSHDLRDHVNNIIIYNYGFMLACTNGHLEIVKYLLTSPELKEHANIHTSNDEGFKNACISNHIDVIKFLIFDMDIEKTNTVKKILKYDKYKEIENMFNMRELNKQLESELNYKSENTILKRNK